MLNKCALIPCLTWLILLFEVTGVAVAQLTYEIPAGFGWRQGLPFDLLEAEAVQKDLGLSAEKAHKLSLWKESVSEAAKPALTSVIDQRQRRAVRHTVERAFQPELDLILTAEQQNRLHEIDLQMEGLDALSDPSVGESLELTSPQKDKILSIHKQMVRAEIDSLKRPRDKYLTMEDRDPLLLDVLSPAQQDRFRQMKGAAFDKTGFLPTLRLRDRELEVWNVRYSPNGKKSPPLERTNSLSGMRKTVTQY